MKRTRMLAAACVSLACSGALAANLGFLGNAPISRMTDEDVDILYRAVAEVLDNGADGAGVDWGNPKTGAGGTLVPLDSFKGPAGQACRHLQVANHAGGLRNKTVLTLCKSPDGAWKAKTD